MALTIEKAGKRDERIAIRLPKRTKFALERYAQRNEMSTSDVINQALEEFLQDPDAGMILEADDGKYFYFGHACWDPLTPDRFLKIATMAPQFLSETERVRWKVISEDAQYFDENGQLNHKRVRDNWNEINKLERELQEIHG